MITLNGVTISDNMFLDGIESSSNVIYTKKTSIGGVSKVYAKRKVNGRELSLGTQEDGKIQGIWCKSQIDQIKEIEKMAVPVILNYRGIEYNVMVVDTSNFKPLHIFEIEGSNKKYTGKILMIEV